MSVTATSPASPMPAVDNRLGYAGFAAAYLLGHGAAALGAAAVLDLPSWLPPTLLVLGLAAGTVASAVAATRSQRGLSREAARPGQLLAAAWLIGFAGLSLAVTGLSRTADPGLQALLWPAGSALVVGLVYLAEGVHRRDVRHYLLGSWLVVVAGVALLLPTAPALSFVAVAGGGGYALATVSACRRQ